MRLAFYSGGYPGDNEDLDLEILRLIGKTNPKMTMIPSAYEGCLPYFEEFKESFEKFGVKEFMLFPIDIPFNSKLLNQALDSDFIFLSGGNTYYFLKKLKETGVLRLIRESAKFNNFVLGGMSAGAIIMTPNISTAAIPSFDRDENDVNLKKLNSMNLVNFEFSPHFLNSKDYVEELQVYSQSSENVIYACPDSSGIVVENEKISFIGRTWGFYEGSKFRVV